MWPGRNFGSTQTGVRFQLCSFSQFNLGKSLVLSRPQTCPGKRSVMGVPVSCVSGETTCSTPCKTLTKRAGTPKLATGISQCHYSNAYDDILSIKP